MPERGGTPLIYIDANPFIYAIEGETAAAEPMKSLFVALQGQAGAAVTSELTLAEVLAPDSSGVPRSPDVRRLYLDLIVWSDIVGLRPVSREVLLETTKLRTMAKLKLPDAIHVCTAILSGCRFFLSGDRSISLPNTISPILPSRDGVDELLGALP